MTSSPHYQAYAVVAPGLEELAAGELRALGLAVTDAGTGGVGFRCDAPRLYAANLWLRTVSRVIVRMATFRATAFWELEKQARKVPWATFVTPGSGVGFRVTSRKSRLYHQRAIAQRLAEAVGHQVPGARETEEEPAQRFLVRIERDECTISGDSSGARLHQRGYRQATARAPLRETLASAMLLGAGWDRRSALLDPFCGSGTIVIEAALMARRIPPGWRRRFAFEQWPAFDSEAWRRVRAEAEAEILSCAPGPIAGSDRDAGAIASARSNAERAGVEGDVEFEQLALSRVVPPSDHGWVITNPPYGVRMGETDRLRDLYARFGRMGNTRFRDWRIGFLAANPRLTGQTGLDLEERWRGTNGGIPVRFLIRRFGGTL